MEARICGEDEESSRLVSPANYVLTHHRLHNQKVKKSPTAVTKLVTNDNICERGQIQNSVRVDVKILQIVGHKTAKRRKGRNPLTLKIEKGDNHFEKKDEKKWRKL
jgi:hypothetical protein